MKILSVLVGQASEPIVASVRTSLRFDDEVPNAVRVELVGQTRGRLIRNWRELEYEIEQPLAAEQPQKRK